MKMKHGDMITVIRAYMDGKPIQYRTHGKASWTDNPCHFEFGPNFGLYEFRVKPEPPQPRERWIAFCPIAGHIERVTESKPVLECPSCQCFFVREVLESPICP